MLAALLAPDASAQRIGLYSYLRPFVWSSQLRTHPGEVLLEEFLVPLGQTQVALAEHLGVPVQRINELVLGKKRGVTPETAWLLAHAFHTTPEFCSNLHVAYDLAKNRPAGKA